jgi:hypothetical protein
MTCRTSCVFSKRWSEKRSLDKESTEMSWLYKVISSDGGLGLMYTQEKGISMFLKHHMLFQNIEKREIQGTTYMNIF